MANLAGLPARAPVLIGSPINKAGSTTATIFGLVPGQGEPRGCAGVSRRRRPGRAAPRPSPPPGGGVVITAAGGATGP